MRLATKISLILVGLLCLATIGNLATLVVAWEIARLLQEAVTQNVASVRAAEELEIALLEQRGLVSAYILDKGEPAWLEELKEKKLSFSDWRARAERTAYSEREKGLLVDLDRVYREYDATRDEVIRQYDRGRPDSATVILLGAVQELYGQAHATCEAFIDANETFIDQRTSLAHTRLLRAQTAAVIWMALTLCGGGGLLLLFHRGVMQPLRSILDDAKAFSGDRPRPGAASSRPDELRAIGDHLRALMSNVTETQSDLARSRLQLESAEKLAALGRLAASIGHEIRNPLTSLQMRLFSIRQAIVASPEVEEDLTVVSEEISRLESIVRNFLEFSRPPDPRFQAIHPAVLIDKTLELCGRWLEEREVSVTRAEASGLPPVLADPEQIKQVLLNLFRNAAEAMEEGGAIRIAVAAGGPSEDKPMVIIRIQDSGPGMPPSVRERIFEPFFSTKPTGTGLGLCIAARILAQHGGRLDLEPDDGTGASMAVWIPAAGGSDGQDSHC